VSISRGRFQDPSAERIYFYINTRHKKNLSHGKKDKAKKGKGADKTIAKTLKKQTNKLKKELAAKGEVN